MDYLRLLRADGPDIARAEAGTPIKFTAATPGKKRDGLNTADLPWRTDRYASNPVVTWVHDLGGNRLPIGRGEAEVVSQAEGEQINASVLFDVADPFAAEVDRKYRAGYLHAVSVSWDDVDEDGIPVRRSGKRAVAHDLLEIAAVPVPGDWDALVERQVTALRNLRAEIDALVDAPTEDGERAIKGSYEAKAEAIREAIRKAGIFGDAYVWVTATFDDSVIAVVYAENGPTRFFRVQYTIAGATVEIGAWTPVRIVEDVEEESTGAEPEPRKLTAGATPGGGAVNDGTNGARPAVGDVDGEMRTAAASAMLAAFDRAAPDDERRTRYNWACVMYRWLKLSPPDWIDGDELRALDDGNWRAVVAGELEVIGDGARVGAELSSRNIADLSDALASIETGAKSIRTLLSRVAEKHPPADEKTEDDEPEDGERGVDEDTIAAVASWLDEQLAQRAGG